ncbi:MAG: uroporphyrinogen decarboxylase family protein [Eubacterium sp.]|nr:uroporphyrinogen decarboxylase family protein [Eubacterium sp.]
MNMKEWKEQLIHAGEKKAMPLLSYPSTQLMYINVEHLVRDANYQALGMKLLADRYPMPFASSYMDLSVEAEAFGANCVYSPNNIPTITGKIVETEEDAEALRIPEVGEGRTGIVIDSIRKAKAVITDRPVIANCSGPFSTAGRLMDVNDILLETLEDPELVEIVVEKTTVFIKKYIKALKEAGADGVIMAEPLAGILSPGLMEEFSSKYVKRIADEVQDDQFLMIYHNCANGLENRVKQVLSTGCRIFHIGDKTDAAAMLAQVPEDVIIMGNVSPSVVFKEGSPVKMEKVTQKLLWKCLRYDNFMVSSGCDIPADTSFANIDRFFETVENDRSRSRLWKRIAIA